MSRFDSKDWQDLAKHLSTLDKASLDHVAFLCWCEQMERSHAWKEEEKNPTEKASLTVIRGGKKDEPENSSSTE